MKFPLLVLFPFSLSAFSNTSISAPITFNTALPVSKNETIIREQLLYRQASNSDTELTQTSLITTAVYGVTSKTTFFATLPFSYTNVRNPNDRISDSGIGDIQLSARYTAYQKNSAGRTLRIAPFSGVELATNNTNFGNSSNNLFAGVVVTYASTDWTADGQISYQNNGSMSGLKIGNELTFDASLQYRLLPNTLSANTTSFLNGVVELNVIKQNRNRVGQNSVRESGGTSVFISPGVQYISRRWITEASLQIPLLNNNQPLETDYTARVGIRVNF